MAGALPNPGTGGPVPGAVALEPGPGGAAVPAAGGGLGQAGGSQAQDSNPIRVTVDENAPESVVHLGRVFAAMSGVQHKDGLQLSPLGNTNSRLVKADLSGTDLTLTYAPGKYGTARITVGATDADRVSVQATVLVTVRPVLFTLPPKSAGTEGAAPAPARAPSAGAGGIPGQTSLAVVAPGGPTLTGASSTGGGPGRAAG
jgi:hypothetical protein